MGYPWRRVWKPTPVFLPGEPHGQKRLVSYSPWDHKESDTTEWLTHTHTHTGAGYSLHNRLVFWKEGDLIINAGCSSGTVKVDKDSKGKREKNISYFTATLKNTSYSQGLLGSKWYRHFKNVHGMVTLSLTKETRIYSGKKTTSLTSGAGKTGQPLVKEWN